MILIRHPILSRIRFHPSLFALAQIASSLWDTRTHPVRLWRTGWDLRPPSPAPALIEFRLWRDKIYPVLADSDGVGFESVAKSLKVNACKHLQIPSFAKFRHHLPFRCHGLSQANAVFFRPTRCRLFKRTHHFHKLDLGHPNAPPAAVSIPINFFHV